MSTNLRLQDDLIVGEVRHALADLVAHPRSDTDIAVLARSPLSATARFDLQERLAARLGRDVDLVDLAGASLVFAVQVIGHGRVKAASIERAVRRVRDEHAGDDRNLLDNQTRQDAIVLNLQRACETSIDAASSTQRCAAS